MYNNVEKKSKSTSRVRGTFFKILGKSRSSKLLSLFLKRRYKGDLVNFPINISSVKQIILILPEEPLQTLYQLKNVISLIYIFKHAAVTLLCEHSIAPVVNMVPGLNVIEYDIEDRVGFKASFLNLSHQFRGNVDICFLLDHQPELAVQYFAATTGADIRIGYEDSGNYPFLNLRVKPSLANKYLQDWNCSISQMFGGTNEDLRWSVARKTVEEVEHLLKESGIEKKCRLAGIDATFLHNRFGAESTIKIIETVTMIPGVTWYILTENKLQNSSWFQKVKVPVLTDFSVSRSAALVTLSEMIITGNTLLYGLATLLDKAAIGFFSPNEFDLYCPQSALLKGIIIQPKVDFLFSSELIAMIQKQLVKPE